MGEKRIFLEWFFLAKTVVNMSPPYTKRCKNTTFRVYVFQIHRFFIFQEKIMISEFWKYNGYNEVLLYFYESENNFFYFKNKESKIWKTVPKKLYTSASFGMLLRHIEASFSQKKSNF